MTGSSLPRTLAYLPNFTTRNVQAIPSGLRAEVADSLAAWATRYLALAVVGVRSPAVTQKTALHLDRFVAFFVELYGHDRTSACLRPTYPPHTPPESPPFAEPSDRLPSQRSAHDTVGHVPPAGGGARRPDGAGGPANGV